MNVTREQSFHYNVKATNTPEQITSDRKLTFRRLILFAAKTAARNTPLVDNDNDIFIAKINDGIRVFTNKISGNAGGQCDSAPYEFLIPDSLPEMPVSDIWVYGTQDDGVLVTFVTSHPNRDA